MSPSPSLNRFEICELNVDVDDMFRMERITECTENVTTDTDTDSVVSNDNFTLRRRKTDMATMRIGDKESSLTKKGLAKLQKDLVKKKDDSNQQSMAPPPPPPPPPPQPQQSSLEKRKRVSKQKSSKPEDIHTSRKSPLVLDKHSKAKKDQSLHDHEITHDLILHDHNVQTQDVQVHKVHESHVHVHNTKSPTSPCDCPAYLHDRESPLVISQV